MHDFLEERLAGVSQRFGTGEWNRIIATSGTASAVACAVNGIPRPKRDRADRLRASTAQVRKLYKELNTLNLGQRRAVTGLGPRRAEIIVRELTCFSAFWSTSMRDRCITPPRACATGLSRILPRAASGENSRYSAGISARKSSECALALPFR